MKWQYVAVKKLLFLGLLFLILNLLSGCAWMDPFYYWDRYSMKKAEEEHVRQLASIDLTDGANQEEANLLGNEYFLRFVNGCGIANKAKDAGNHWEVWYVEGIAALPGKDPIYIDKTTGVISLKGHPTVSDPLKTFLIKR